MLIAKNHRHHYCQAKLATKEEDYYCPSCLQEVVLKIGKVKTPYFAHKKVCSQNLFSEGETIEHVQGKQYLYDLLSKHSCCPVLEPYIKTLKQRPDILFFYKHQQYVIEFQCSFISSEKIRQRTEGYVKEGYHVIWIVGRKLFLSHNLFFAQTTPVLSLFHLNTQTKKLYQKTVGYTHAITLVDLLSNQSKRYQLNVRQTPNQYSKRCLSKACLRYLYERRIAVCYLPSVLFIQKKHYLGLATSFIEVLIYVFCKIQKDKKVTFYILFQYLVWLVKHDIIRLKEMPLIDKHTFIYQFMYDALFVLEKINCITCMQDSVFIKKQ
ncbi:hypothetical protein H1220_03370 [Carnobacteriaceae bacterium zg-84]|uniref:competence protein CoiA n=1 Tax=Granulicatella sp. zg-84 TaxID=2678503 RepID=UPI0013C184F2|nr:competence protein CoiA family protein [Granulicatella sp. zg-84]NEW65865.1 hypothetical protein [Granulicatella sp. zg-84]QMI86402.1 hypothetical protein H1220_03370 [Carnobacteriaceae bacterium zg-84]